MVGVIGIDRPGTVQLLYQQHTRHGVRQRQVGQAYALMRAGPKSWLQAVGPTNDQCHVATAGLPIVQALR